MAPYLIRTEKREAIDNNGNLLFKNRITHLVELQWDERHSFQRELCELVSHYGSKTYDKAKRNRKKNMCLIFLLIIMQRMVTSSTAAVHQSIERRLEALKFQNTRIGSLTEADLAEMEIDELEHIIAVAKQAEFQYPDVKVERLVDTIDEILSEDRNQYFYFHRYRWQRSELAVLQHHH